MLINFCIIFCLLVPAIAALGAISTPNGLIQGVESITEQNNKVFAFLGIRYGQSPTGNLRFRAPLPTPSWSKVYNATVQGNECVQSPLNSTVVSGNEDCLFLNVYTPQLPGGTTQPLPVMVWIHGGGFLYGNGNLDLHGADGFLDNGVVLVSFNYRLGIFGFISTEDNIVPGNYGLKDQVLALKWVKKNIEYFGGDPNEVTIFGQSAGAASVQYLRQSELANGLFKRAIAQSGNTLNPWAISRNARARAFSVGVTNSIIALNSKALVEGLRKVDAVQLQQTSSFQTLLLVTTDVLNGLSFSPVLEGLSAEAVYTKFSYETQKIGDFICGTLLHGFNSLEGRDFANLPWYGNLYLEQYNLDPSKLTPLDMNASDNGKRRVGQNIRSYYFKNQSVSTGFSFAYYFSDNEFVRGIIKSTQLQRHFCDVYLYRFSFTGGSLHSNSPAEGVAHADENQFLFDAPEFVQTTPEALLTKKRMQHMWTNFAKTGNPTSSTSGAIGIPTWPLVSDGGDDTLMYMDIGADLVVDENPEQEQMEFWEDQYDVNGYPPYNTY